MKASESLPNYDSKVRESTNFIIKSIRQVCKDTPERRAGSENEKKAQEYVRKTMEPFADSIQTQEFKTKVNAEGGMKKIGISIFISVLLACAAGIICFLLPEKNLFYLFFIPVVAGFIPFIIPAKKAASSNIIAVKSPSGERKRRIVFMGNINSPVERNFYRIGSPALEKIVLFYAYGASLCIVFNLFYGIGLMNGLVKFSPLFALVELIFLPAGFLMIKYYNTKQEVHGANGNLTGEFDALAVIQYLSYNNLSLENTEVVAVSCGAGIDGAFSASKKYKEEFNDVETVFVCVDTLQSLDAFSMSGNQTELVFTAAENANVKITNGKDILCSSLEEAFADNKYPFARISGCDTDSGIFATREDTINALSPMAIEAGLKLSLEAAYLFDEKGL